MIDPEIIKKCADKTGKIFSGQPRNPDRISRILEKLQLIWAKHPDIRFNQLIINVNYFGGKKEDEFFNLEDEEFELFLDQWMNSYS